MEDVFYCYSDRLFCWLKALRFRYKWHGINSSTNKDFWTYEKSEKLDEAINLYNSMKYKFN